MARRTTYTPVVPIQLQTPVVQVPPRTQKEVPYGTTTLLVDSTVISHTGTLIADTVICNNLTGGSGGGGGNPFDQSLNTTDNVQFNQVSIQDVAEMSVYQSNNQNQLGFNLGEQGFSMGYDTNRAINAISYFGNALYMNNGVGANGGSIFMDGGQVVFPMLNGNYGQPAYMAGGTTDAGFGGGISLFCNATYEMNWQNGVLTVNGTGNNNSGFIQNVNTISGPIVGSANPAHATLTFDPNNLPSDGQLIVMGFWSGGSGNQQVFTYMTSPTGANQFNLDPTDQSNFLTNVLNNYAQPNGHNVICSFNGSNVITINTLSTGSDANQQNGSTLANVTLTDFAGGNDGDRLVILDSDVIVTGTFAAANPHTTLTETDNNSTLGLQYDIYFLFVGQDNVQFTVNLPDASQMTGRELTFINSGQQSEFYPSIAGNINNSAGNTYNLSNTTVKMLSDGTTWWITSQV